MKILFINPILYTSETKHIQKKESIEDCMSVSLCKSFSEAGHDVTLYACSEYKPLKEFESSFKIIFDKPKFKRIFSPNKIPYLPRLKKFVLNNNFDVILTSECFSLSTYTVSKILPTKVFIWQELASYQKFLHEIPAKFWYKVIFRNLFKKVCFIPRSERAREFILRFNPNISRINISHGCDLNVFLYKVGKNKQFIIVSQLIKRKHVDKSIEVFFDFCSKYDPSYKLYIAGEGIEKEKLIGLVNKNKYKNNVIFLGFLSHKELIIILSKSKAMLVNTSRDLNMVSIDESLACCTPVITNSVPFTSDYIKEKQLGIVNDNWSANDLLNVSKNNIYVDNCIKNREYQDYKYKVKQFIEVFETRIIKKGHKNEK
jgi:1,2-diacylglycerol 3-alpha-glucosyltransferase